MDTSFYSDNELAEIGFKDVGTEVFISKKTSIYKPETIVIGNKVRIDDFCVLAGGFGIELGSFIHIGCFSALYGGFGIIMRDFSGLSARVTIYTESDDYSGHSLTNPMTPNEFKPRYHRGQVTLGRHCIVGASTTILPGVTIGDGASIGAHSLVTKNCDEWTMFTGVPAKRLKHRSNDLLTLEKQFIEQWNSQKRCS
ncbi:acyltransferase [Desulfobacterales bacterium HSG16]|nr:acyltransferase [Desulfobacterales bacterium HSG16]